MKSHMLPKIGANGSTENLEWKIIEHNEDGRIKCFDCDKTFSCLRSAQIHHERIHIRRNEFDCIYCHKFFPTEDIMKAHMVHTHMLPKKIGKGSTEKLKWEVFKSKNRVLASIHGLVSCSPPWSPMMAGITAARARAGWVLPPTMSVRRSICG